MSGRTWGGRLARASVMAVLAAAAVSCSASVHISVGSYPSTSTPKAPPEQVTGTPALPGVAVDPAEATIVARRLWSLRAQAVHFRDLGQIRELETGPALEADLGYLCTTRCEIPLFTADTVTANVPSQPTWPAAFFASVTYRSYCMVTTPPCVDSFVATQASRDAPWKIELYVTYSGSIYAEQPRPGPDGFAATATPPPDQHLDTLPAEYARYYQSVKDTGRPPADTRLAPGPFTTELVQHVYQSPAQLQALGWVDTTMYRVGGPADRVWYFAAIENTTVVCGTIRYHAITQARPGRAIEQPADLREFGHQLSAGRYASVTQDGLHMACFDTQAQLGAPVYLVGTWGESTHVTGAPIT